MINIINTWDSPLPGAIYDTGLQYDVNVGGLTGGSIASWLALITAEHADKPNYMATLSFVLQPFADDIAVLNTFTSSYDVDTAVGAQLDIIGKWVNASRNITTAITGVYFSLDTTGLGFDQGQWFNPFSPTTQLAQLADTDYRRLIKFKILINQWDGSAQQVYSAWNSAFTGTGLTLILQDIPGMRMAYGLLGTPDALTRQLFLGGYYAPRPSGVQIVYFMLPSVAATPFFGFDAQNANVAGFDTGAWGTLYPGN